MKARLMGTPDECAALVALLHAHAEVREVSTAYPNRGESRLVRVYVDLDPVSVMQTRRSQHNDNEKE